MRTGCHFEPAPISAVPAAPDLTMRMAFRLLESMTTPSATWVCPKNECPWPRIAILTPWRFANCTSFAMSCASLGRSTAAGFLCTTRPKSSAATCNTASSKDSSPLISFRSLRSDCPAAGQFHADCNARNAAPPASRLPKSRREILRCMIHLPRSMLVLMASDSRAAEQPDEIAASHGGYPRPTDHELRIAGLEWISERASQQKAVPLVRVGSVASHPDLRDAPGHVRYASNSDPIGASQRSVATCQDRT